MQLNPKQRAAVCSEAKTLVLIAGPGSGKTRTLVSRIQHLVTEGIAPGLITAISFTNAAANEILARLKGVPRLGHVGTLHSYMLLLLRRYGPALLGLPNQMAVIEEGTREDLIAEIVHELGYTGSRETLDKALAVVPMLEPPRKRRGAELVSASYHVRLLENGLLDYDSILSYGLHLIRQWKANSGGLCLTGHLLVDEFQDSGDMDAKIYAELPVLYGKTYVGDSDQCQPAGTIISMSDGTHKRIEDVKPGDKVVSYSRHCKAFIRSMTVTAIASRPFNGNLFSVSADGKTTRCTGNHKWLIRWQTGRDRTQDIWCTYLMRKGDHFRIGKTMFFRAGGGTQGRDGNGYYSNRVIGLGLRVKQEGADSGWVLKLHNSEGEATAHEQIMAATYGLPEACFKAAVLCRQFTQAVLDTIFAGIPNQLRNATRCLQAHGRELEYPLIDNKAKRTRRTVQEIHACNLLPGLMQIPVMPRKWVKGPADNKGKHLERNGHWETIDVIQEPFVGQVYSLDVATHHKYVADGLVTCNSIYAFRGGNPSHLLALARDEWSEVVILDQNYRSGVAICQAADALISHNPDRVRKTNVPATTLPGRVEAHSFATEAMETAALGGQLLLAPNPEECAVLVRTNAMVASLAQALRGMGLPIREKKSLDLPKDWKKCRMLVAFLANPENDLLAFSMVKMLKGPAQAKIIRAEAAAALQSINAFHIHWASDTALDGVQAVLARAGISRESLDRVAKVVATLTEPHISALTLALAEEEAHEAEIGAGVYVGTIHSAKGREFDQVFLPGWNDEIFPSQARGESLEEIRRLAFVAVTRARENVWIAYVLDRKPFPLSRQVVPMTPSRFIAELMDNGTDTKTNNVN